MKRDNQKSIALITGASGGIGSAIARKFAQNGYAVILHCHQNPAKAQKLAEELAGYTDDVMVWQADLRSSAEVNQMVENIEMLWGTVDVLVNNAGIAQQKLFTDITDDDWRNMMATHLDGSFYCARATLKGMLSQHKGSIINISSMWGQVGGACEVHYSAAKGAIQSMTKALAKEVGPSGIRVNCVAPGMIMTDMNATFDEDTIRAIAEETPLQKNGLPEEVAEMVYYLASEAASFVTGQIIGINGGLVV